MIRLVDISIQVGDFRLEKVSLEVPTGCYGVLMGRTGSGKTTLLESLAGLKRTIQGSVYLSDRDVTSLKPAERNLGYVPQDGALFPTMTVRDNLGFALTIRRTPKQELRRRVDELAEMLGIGNLLDRSVHGLSGGERQRVALGRALSFHPTTLLLDEPLSALDDQTREDMYTLLKEVQSRTNVTALHVTHNIEDTLRLADRLYRIESGKVLRRPLPAENASETQPRPQGTP